MGKMGRSTPLPRQWRIWLANAALTTAATAQHNMSCFYPNGDLATSDYPCLDTGGVCCPLNWECLDNGLCYLESEDYLERHSCTYSDWTDGICPDFCTSSASEAGNEAVLLCEAANDTSWCCDRDRQSGDCCSMPDRYFSLDFGFVVATITSAGVGVPLTASAEPATTSESIENMPSISDDSDPTTSIFAAPTPTPGPDSVPVQTTSSTSSPSSSTSPSSSEMSTTQQTTAAAPFPPTTTELSTTTIISLSSDPAGQVSTQTIISILTTTPTPSSPSPTTTSTSALPSPITPSPSPSLPTILATSIGLPIFLATTALLLFTLHRRRRTARRNNPRNNPFHPPPDTSPSASDFKSSTLAYPTPAEIDSRPGPTELDTTSPSSSSRYPSPMTTQTSQAHSRWSEVSSMRDAHADLSPKGLGLGQPLRNPSYPPQSPMARVPEEAGLGRYMPYRAYRPAYELAGREVRPGDGVGVVGEDGRREETREEEMRDEGLFPNLHGVRPYSGT